MFQHLLFCKEGKLELDHTHERALGRHMLQIAEVKTKCSSDI